MTAPIIITTRPLDDAARDIADLRQKGITALAAPMLEIKPLADLDLPSPRDLAPRDFAPRGFAPRGFDGIVLTSRHAAAMITDPDWHDLPCYCVGASTAIAAKDRGFRQIITGPGDGKGLVERILADKRRSLFWPSAVDTGFNMAEALKPHGISTLRLPVYKAAHTTAWPDDVDAALRDGKVAAILMHSGRAGEHFSALMERHGLSAARQDITAIVISSRAAGLCGQGWHNIVVAATPRRSAMFAEAAIALGLSPTLFDDDRLDQDL